MNDFGEYVDVYTRAEAIEDGVLIDVSDMARQAGFRVPVALTAAVWSDFVAWRGEDSARLGIHQDERGRLWDILFLAGAAARRHKHNDRRTILFDLSRVPNDDSGGRPMKTTLKLMVHAGDGGECVATVLLPNED